MDFVIVSEGNETMRSLGALHLSEKRRFIEGRYQHQKAKQEQRDGPPTNSLEATSQYRQSLEKRRDDTLSRIENDSKGYQ